MKFYICCLKTIYVYYVKFFKFLIYIGYIDFEEFTFKLKRLLL